MKICRIQIQLAEKSIFLTKNEQGQRERAALEEVYLLLPILNRIEGAVPSLAVGAIGDQVFLSVSILSGSGIEMDVGKWSTNTRRVLEIDHSAATQVELIECIQLTQLLLAKAAMGEPDSIRKFREEFETKVKGKFANQFRRELGKRFRLSVEGAQHWIQKPLLPTQFVEVQLRTYKLIVQGMNRNFSFKCSNLNEVRVTPPLEPFSPDLRVKFDCTRIHAARTFAQGQLIHASMESQQPIEAVCQLVRDHYGGDVIALQVQRVQLPKSV